MTLIDDFCCITALQETESGFEYTLSLNKEHYIYKVHFPQIPITPGVCLIQICTELAGKRWGHSFSLKKIHNVKFLSVIDPTCNDRIQIAFSRISMIGNRYKFSAVIHGETHVFSKLMMEIEAI
jgi:3-hydroxyacyl-[acyl-carrier-protein] dehydratase